MSSAVRRFRDAHTHLSAGACDLLDLDLRAVSGPEDVLTRVAREARERPHGAWIRGWGWDPGSSRAAEAPDALTLTRAAGDHPVFLARRDGHGAWLSPAAAQALGVPGGGGPIGEELFERARLGLPEPSPEARDRAIAVRVAELEKAGIASVDDMVDSWGPGAWALRRDRGLALAVGLWLPDGTSAADADAVRREMPEGDPRLAVRGAKIFLDGTLSGRTAALHAPYADAPSTTGRLRLTVPELRERVGHWAGQGWPVAIHAIGDRAVTLALDVLEWAPKPSWGAHRIEHAQVVLRTDLARFAAAGVVASLQPGHWRDDRAWLPERLGARDDVVLHPLASLRRTGAAVLFGSDWPVSSWDPDEVISAAADPARGEEAVSREEAWHLAAAEP